MPTFMERMRAPMLLGSGDFSGRGVGRSDPLARATSLAELDEVSGGSLSRKRNLAMRKDPNDWIKQTAIMRRGLPAGVENVVYDQRPENFKKEMDLKNREVDAKIAMTESINAIRQQQADTGAKRADAYDFGVRNPLGQVVTPRGGNATVIDRRTGRAIDTGVAGGTMTQEDELLQRAQDALNQGAQRGEQASALETQRQGGRVDLAGMANDARMAAIAAQGKAAEGRQEDAQSFRANQPRERAATINNKAREVAANDPSMGQFLEFDPQGNFKFKDGTPEDTQKVITSRIYGPQARDINLGKGSDAPSLNRTGGEISGTMMTFPDGTKRMVRPDQREAAIARGAK